MHAALLLFGFPCTESQSLDADFARFLPWPQQVAIQERPTHCEALLAKRDLRWSDMAGMGG